MLDDNRIKNTSLYLTPAALLLIVVGVIPIGFVLFYAVHDTFGGNVSIWVGMQWFQELFTTPEFYHALMKSFLFAILALSIQIPLGIFLALRLPAPGWRTTACIVLLSLPMLTPAIVVGYLWKVMVQPGAGLLMQSLAAVGLTLDMTSSLWTWAVLLLMDTWHWTGLVVLLCYARLRSIPISYYQAASIDGASSWSVFKYIQLPRLRLVLAIAVLLRFMDSFTLYTEVYVLTRGGPGVSTTFLSHELVQTALVQFDLGPAGAMATLYFAIVLIVSAFFYRLIVPNTDVGVH